MELDLKVPKTYNIINQALVIKNNYLMINTAEGKIDLNCKFNELLTWLK